MKTITSKLLTLASSALIVGVTTGACAQSLSTTNAIGGGAFNNPQTFFQSVGGYFTSANTNFNWTNNVIEAAVGADYLSGVNFAQFVEGQYDLGRWDVEAKMRNASIGGIVDSVEAGAGYTFIQYYSVKVQGSLTGGFDLDRNCGLIEPKITLRDKPTANTFFGAAVSLPVWFEGTMNRTPCVSLETGFTY
jgi:hypothetical protein